MGKRGRPKGSSSKSCLIQDPLIAPYEVHVDETNHQYILYDASNKSNIGYYINMVALLKAIMRRKFVPTGGNNNIYTLREYIKCMSQIRDEISSLLESPYHTTT